MLHDPAVIFERRRIKRHLNFWRVFGVVALLIVAFSFVPRSDYGGFGDHVARLKVSGIILNDSARDTALRMAAKQKDIRALIVEINSPGGTFVGGEALFRYLREIARNKPVVAVLGGTATSAAYMAAIGSDYIIARNGTITGSIGVIMQTADITNMLSKLGIKPETIKSGPLKAQPNPLENFTPDARGVVKELIHDLYVSFIEMVETRRGMTKKTVMALADGRVFSGRQALDNGMVDAIGGIPEARAWLEKKYQIGVNLRLEDLEIKDNGVSWLSFFRAIIGKTLFSERLRLDGVLSVWQR